MYIATRALHHNCINKSGNVLQYVRTYIILITQENALEKHQMIFGLKQYGLSNRTIIPAKSLLYEITRKEGKNMNIHIRDPNYRRKLL